MFRHIFTLGPRSISAITVRSRRALSSTAKPVSAPVTSDDRPNLDVKHLKHPTKVPQQPHKSDIDRRQEPVPRISVDDQTVQLLERLSLVDLDSKEAHRTLEDSIEFASRILAIDTDGVEPLYTVLEKQKLALREDVVSDGNLQEDVLSNARITEEEYFVAPPGNIPLEQDSSGNKHKQ
ncbi:AAEL011360-PA [Aedes aegypti]|uniref:Glutamyl-tRNA(Gln) amidotransferase subunit C, mitochondrial n=1 Tax=Aedes aegypti TaxID=7159 RepID=GATC_AEDAE|nr:RecName: Full=Glutamyl-tRNA(Gln) amidotransferase subunit C, mitochondrial; Short=Glu-AdT subunit C; Flags: Precursor [Aedes aegypti]EAT36567.1 AAEL011360-PA [Aedes aegypti]